jgi:hypothetical protein
VISPVEKPVITAHGDNTDVSHYGTW